MASADDTVLLKIKEWGVDNSNIIILKKDRTFEIFETTRFTGCKKGTIDSADFKKIKKLLNSKEVTSYKFKSRKDQCETGTKFKIYLKGKEYVHTWPCSDSLEQKENLLLTKLDEINESIEAMVKTVLEYCQDGYYVKLIGKDSAVKNCSDTSLNINAEEIFKIPGAHVQNLKKALKSFSLFYIGDNKEFEKTILKKRIIESEKCFFVYLYKSKNSVLEYINYLDNIPPNRDCGDSENLKFSFSMNGSERKRWDRLLECKGVNMIRWFADHVEIPYNDLKRKIAKNLETGKDEERMKFYLGLEDKVFSEMYLLLIEENEAFSAKERKELELKIKKEIESAK
jgi:hypothetical protein